MFRTFTPPAGHCLLYPCVNLLVTIIYANKCRRNYLMSIRARKPGSICPDSGIRGRRGRAAATQPPPGSAEVNTAASSSAAPCPGQTTTDRARSAPRAARSRRRAETAPARPGRDRSRLIYRRISPKSVTVVRVRPVRLPPGHPARLPWPGAATLSSTGISPEHWPWPAFRSGR
jgi:hypothetical protein